MAPDQLATLIKEKARIAGFDLCGITDAAPLPLPALRLMEWLSKGCNAGMGYMSRNMDKRVNPGLLMPGARSVIVVALNYYSDSRGEEFPVISRYAAGEDYHMVVKRKLKTMLSALQSEIPDLEGRVFTDSAPLMEKALAVKAGLGNQGRNSLLITRDEGSFFFLGEVLINMYAMADSPADTDPCGNCRRCVDACPTGAIREEGYIDAGKCISYLTIEHDGEIPEELKAKLKGRVFGCDICQDVCPHNSKAREHQVPEFLLSPERGGMTGEDWKKLTPESFSSLFRGSAVERCGYEKFMRNLSQTGESQVP